MVDADDTQMSVYAGLGVSQAIFYFFMGAMFALLTYYASQRLHKVSWYNHIDGRVHFMVNPGSNRTRDARTYVIFRDNGEDLSWTICNSLCTDVHDSHSVALWIGSLKVNIVVAAQALGLMAVLWQISILLIIYLEVCLPLFWLCESLIHTPRFPADVYKHTLCHSWCRHLDIHNSTMVSHRRFLHLHCLRICCYVLPGFGEGIEGVSCHNGVTIYYWLKKNKW